RRARRAQELHRGAARCHRRRDHGGRRHGRGLHRLRRHPPFEPPGRLSSMSQEIVEAVKALGREKGIAEEKLMGALEDALLSAYKKQPGAARYARVRMDRDSGDFIVEEFLLPPDLEDQLLDEAEEQATGALERRVDPETGEVIIPEAPDIDPGRLSDFEDQIEIRD